MRSVVDRVAYGLLADHFS